MTGHAVAMLWLHGPSGVGKTTVAWQLYSELARAGDRVGYVDVDQLGICFPEPESDPGRYRLAAANLRAVVAGYRAAGAQAVIVSGVVDPIRGVYVDEMPGVALTTCRLRVDADELARRLVGRDGDGAMVSQELAEAATLDAMDLSDVCIDTTGLPVDEVVRLVQDRTKGWTTRTGSAAGVKTTEDIASDRSDGAMLWLCGATGVGKSTAGFTVYLGHVLGRGTPGAYVDLDQIGCYRPAGSDPGVNHAMRAGILAEMWRNFRAAGANCMVMVGPADSDAAIAAYADAVPAATVTVCRLHAGSDELFRRITLRGEGRGSWVQPGDPLKGQPASHLAYAAEQAAADAALLDRAGVGDVRVDTDGRTPEEVAADVIAATGWLTA